MTQEQAEEILQRIENIESAQAVIIEGEKTISFYSGQTSAINFIILTVIIMYLFFKLMYQFVKVWI